AGEEQHGHGERAPEAEGAEEGVAGHAPFTVASGTTCTVNPGCWPYSLRVSNRTMLQSSTNTTPLQPSKAALTKLSRSGRLVGSTRWSEAAACFLPDQLAGIGSVAITSAESGTLRANGSAPCMACAANHFTCASNDRSSGLLYRCLPLVCVRLHATGAPGTVKRTE